MAYSVVCLFAAKGRNQGLQCRLPLVSPKEGIADFTADCLFGC